MREWRCCRSFHTYPHVNFFETGARAATLLLKILAGARPVIARVKIPVLGWPWDSGNTAVLETDHATLVVGTRAVSLFDRSWFYANGQDPRRFDAVVVKSPHCEPHMFADWCAKLINVDAPGSTSANLRSLGHTICARPLFPLDEGVGFHPEADIFQRRESQRARPTRAVRPSST